MAKNMIYDDFFYIAKEETCKIKAELAELGSSL
jgi:hypothetical protein